MSRSATMIGALAAAFAIGWIPGREAAGAAGYCTQTALGANTACGLEARDDYAKAQAICINVSDAVERTACQSEAGVARSEALELCGDQLRARKAVCAAIGEGRYDPDFDPEDFEGEFDDQDDLNRYLPLAIGNRWKFAGGGEIVQIEVLDETKLIEGVTCIVVNDVVTIDGELVEDTDDWFAQAENGDVYYFGEEVKDYESFEGDAPRNPELVSIDGSFKVGRDGDKPGISFKGAPRAGQVYRQEFSLGNAEDMAEVLSTTYRFGSNADLDRGVPRQLADQLCAGDCVVTREFSALDPEAHERKYYAPGIGFFLQVDIATGGVVQLVDCSFDARCARLPAP